MSHLPRALTARPRLPRAVFHVQRGELRQRDREGQENQLAALGLVVNAVILWNTRYMERALRQLPGYGFDVRTEDVVTLNPFVRVVSVRHKHDRCGARAFGT
jgi:Tn3 transposase DDE domain-containing protein